MITITFISSTLEHTDILQKELSSAKLNNTSFNYKSGRIETISDLQYDVLISPANSYGDLKGGIDMCYYRLLGREKLAERVRQYIRTYADGEIHIGDFGIVPIAEAVNSPKYLILCPTMVIPMILPEYSRSAYLYMRAVIKATRKLSNTIFADKQLTVMCPIPCVGVGGMDPRLAAKQIRLAIESMNGTGIIHAINMTQKEEDNNTFKLPYYYATEKMQNMRLAYKDSVSYP